MLFLKYFPNEMSIHVPHINMFLYSLSPTHIHTQRVCVFFFFVPLAHLNWPFSRNLSCSPSTPAAVKCMCRSIDFSKLTSNYCVWTRVGEHCQKHQQMPFLWKAWMNVTDEETGCSSLKNVHVDARIESRLHASYHKFNLRLF